MVFKVEARKIPTLHDLVEFSNFYSPSDEFSVNDIKAQNKSNLTYDYVRVRYA